MGPEIVSVSAGGAPYVSWRHFRGTAGLNDAARTFELECVHELGASATSWLFGAGTAVSLTLNGNLFVAGYVDRYRPRITAEERVAIVSGRSKAGDFVDSSAEHDTGELRQKTVLDLAKALDKYGVGVKTDATLTKIPVLRITKGETAFRAVERYCRSQGLTLCGQADGSILITQGGTKRHAGGLIEGHNILTAEADHNWSGRHSEYRVVGQRPEGHGASNLEIERIARDAAVGRHRPVIVVVEEDIDHTRATTRAKNRRDRAAGASLQAKVTVQGFRDDAGTLWEPGYLVYTEAPSLAIQQDMLIESVELEQSGGEGDGGGSIATLSLVDPRAYGGKPGKGNKSGKAWKVG